MKHGPNIHNQTQECAAPETTIPLRFTLIELLVVVAIIAILAAMLLPVLQGTRATSLRTTCLSNQKQTFLAISMYTDDHTEYVPAMDKAMPMTDPQAWFNADGQGHYWKDLLVNGNYTTADVVNGTGSSGGGYQWETWHPGDTGKDGHFFYGGPFSGGGHETGDIPQTRWPPGSGYQPQQMSLIRDVNIKFKQNLKTRSLLICPTQFITPWGTKGWIMREPHGRRWGITWWEGAGTTADNAYDRNCTFTDGHAESRQRARNLVGDYLNVTTPWMNGDWSYNTSTTADPAN